MTEKFVQPLSKNSVIHSGFEFLANQSAFEMLANLLFCMIESFPQIIIKLNSLIWGIPARFI